MQSVAKVLGVPLGSDDLVARIGRAIAARGPALVVLDNFEQVARYARDSVGRWLDRAYLDGGLRDIEKRMAAQ